MKYNVKFLKMTFLAFMLIVGGYCLVTFFVETRKFLYSTLNGNWLYTENFDKEDSTLFKKTALIKIKPIRVYKSNYRNDIKCFDYADLGKLLLVKIDLLNDSPLSRLIEFRKAASDETTMHTYSKIIGGDGFECYMLEEKITKVDKVIFNFSGDKKQLQKKIFNRNFCSFYLSASSLSIRYGADAPTDIFFGGKEHLLGRNSYPVMVSFYKKQKSLYILFLIPKSNQTNLNVNLIGDIMNDNEK